MRRRKHASARQRICGFLRRLAEAIAGCRRLGRRVFRRWSLSTKIEVLVADPARRRSLDREVRILVGTLEGLIPLPEEMHAAVVVQQVIHSDDHLVGAVETVGGPAGCRLNLIRLPLQVNGTRLSTDEVLAALAEQWVYLVSPDAPRVGIRVVGEAPPQPSAAPRPVVFRPDPLVAQAEQPPDRAA